MMQKANRSLDQGALLASAMLPLSPHLKDAFEKFEQDFQAANLPEGKYINPLLPLLSGINWDNLVLRTNYLWGPYGQGPLTGSPKSLSIRLGKTSVPLIFRLPSLRLPYNHGKMPGQYQGYCQKN